MAALPVIAIFDIGKTNKKLFLFDEQYRIVWSESTRLEESADEDGFPCEDIDLLTGWVTESFQRVLQLKKFIIKAVNFSAYGASFVHLDDSGRSCLPLYNYLKPYPASLQHSFYQKYGGETSLSVETASPVLGNLNSGLQLYFLKQERPGVFAKIRHSLHLPQYLAYLVSGNICSEITSIGCHTHLWDFNRNTYHEWVVKEGIRELLPPISRQDHLVRLPVDGGERLVGIGLHDSSAALIPYLANFSDSFVLISTGTWCISLNPFNHSPLTPEELANDCLCYFTYNARPVKASRLFAGNIHENEVKRLAAYFNKPLDYYTGVSYDASLISELKTGQQAVLPEQAMHSEFILPEDDLSYFDSYEQAYHQLMRELVARQARSASLVIRNTAVRRIFVDGGFSKNSVYMFLLARAFPGIEVYAAAVAQASAIGAALVIHPYWNKQPLSGNILELKYYSSLPVTT